MTKKYYFCRDEYGFDFKRRKSKLVRVWGVLDHKQYKVIGFGLPIILGVRAGGGMDSFLVLRIVRLSKRDCTLYNNLWSLCE